MVVRKVKCEKNRPRILYFWTFNEVGNNPCMNNTPAYPTWIFPSRSEELVGPEILVNVQGQLSLNVLLSEDTQTSYLSIALGKGGRSDSSGKIAE